MEATSYQGPGTGPHPASVPGFDEARRLGLLPSVPATPPQPVCVNSLHASVAFFPVIFGYLLAGIALANAYDLSDPLTGLVLGGGGGALIVAAILIPGRLMMREFEAGYCRRDAHIGLYVIDWRVQLQNQAGPAGAEWDLRGLWRLDGHNRPVRAPAPGVLPVGRYPSPNRPGLLEYWTGRDWHYMFRKPSRDFTRPGTSTGT